MIIKKEIIFRKVRRKIFYHMDNKFELIDSKSLQFLITKKGIEVIEW